MEYRYEPPRLETLLTGLAGATVMARYYRDFAASLGLSGNERVLDWCAGSGAISAHIARRLPSGSLIYADVSETWLRFAGRRLRSWSNASPARLACFEGPVAGGSYGLIVVHYALHDFPEALRPMILGQLAQNLAPGGTLALREPVSRAGSHGISPHSLFNLLEAHKELEYQYGFGRHRLAGEYVDARCRLRREMV